MNTQEWLTIFKGGIFGFILGIVASTVYYFSTYKLPIITMITTGLIGLLSIYFYTQYIKSKKK